MQTENQAKILAEILFSATENKSEQQQQEIAQNFLKVLKNKKKIYLLPQILKELKKISKKDEIELTFSREIQDEDIKRTEEKLRSIFGKEKIFKIKTDKRLISGFVAKTNNYLIDASISGVLEKMKIEI
jgi:F0F1-type ATP synthase delta subunit